MTYPDIIIITDANEGISSKTLKSIVRYAPHCACIIKPNLGLSRTNDEFIQNERLATLKKSRANYVLIMDDDDELVSSVPSCDQIEEHDVVFFNYTQDNGPERSFLTCESTQIFVFCGVILKRAIAVKALEYTVQNKYLREDIGFFYFLVKNIPNIYYSNSVLINKIKNRDPFRYDWMPKAFGKELRSIWQPRITELRLNHYS